MWAALSFSLPSPLGSYFLLNIQNCPQLRYRVGYTRDCLTAWYLALGTRGHDIVPVTAASFATENAPKCSISRAKILIVTKLTSHWFQRQRPPCCLEKFMLYVLQSAMVQSEEIKHFSVYTRFTWSLLIREMRRIATARWRRRRNQNASLSVAWPPWSTWPEVMRPGGWREGSAATTHRTSFRHNVESRPAINDVEMTSSGCTAHARLSPRSRCELWQIVSLIAYSRLAGSYILFFSSLWRSVVLLLSLWRLAAHITQRSCLSRVFLIYVQRYCVLAIWVYCLLQCRTLDTARGKVSR